MKTASTIFFLMTATLLTAQVQVSWIGGTYGQETNWDCPSNWSTGSVPDEDSHVVIAFLNSGHHAQPVIEDEAYIASLEIRSMGNLTVEKGALLMIDGSDNYSTGIALYGGSVNNKGSIHLIALDQEMSSDVLASVDGEGKIFVEGSQFIPGMGSTFTAQMKK